jgi:RNA polymerase sigma-70 factor (ECF subfamily)
VPAGATVRAEEESLQQRAALDQFLAGVERRAYRMARLAVRDPDAALDIVQESMLKLVRSYAGRTPEEWQLLFFRILKNCILDHQRRQVVRRRLYVWRSPAEADEEEEDPMASVPGRASDAPDHQVAMGDAMEALQGAVSALPARQQQAFLLRALEGLDVAQTAAVMGCSEGSVKTHYFRALAALREVLGEHWS